MGQKNIWTALKSTASRLTTGKPLGFVNNTFENTFEKSMTKPFLGRVESKSGSFYTF